MADDQQESTANPGGRFADKGDAENAKTHERRSPEEGLHRQDPQEVAERMKSGGPGMVDKGR